MLATAWARNSARSMIVKLIIDSGMQMTSVSAKMISILKSSVFCMAAPGC